MSATTEQVILLSDDGAATGDAFSVKRFHSAVLDSGSLPLGVLDEVVRRRLP